MCKCYIKQKRVLRSNMSYEFPWMMNITEFKCTCHFFCYNPWINAALLSLVAAFYSIATFMDDFLLFVVFTQESGILLGIYGYSNHKFKS